LPFLERENGGRKGLISEKLEELQGGGEREREREREESLKR